MRAYITIITVLLLLIGVCSGIQAQEVYRTRVLRDDIKSLEVKVEGEVMSSPFIALNGENRIVISFDALHHSTGRFAYSVIHCNADWTKSGLIPIEYMKGFQREVILDFANASGTTTNYTNYKLSFPNEDTQFVVSGNYAIQIFEEDAPGKVLIIACFSIVEQLVEIEADVSGNTDIDFNREHQQVEFFINTKNMNIPFPQTDLKVLVYQNNNLNDIRANLQPAMISNNRLLYRNNRDLIFEAGNEYRRIEFLTHRYYGMNVETIAYYNPYYHISLYQDNRRDNKPYQYDQDQNGRFFINCSGCINPNIEGDYYVAHFSFASDHLRNVKMYLYGDFFNNILDNKSLMEYNSATGAYEKSVLLKTGLYNYQYVFMEEGETKSSLKQTEGNFFATENEYNISVYYRPIGARYDKLIGHKIVNSKLF